MPPQLFTVPSSRPWTQMAAAVTKAQRQYGIYQQKSRGSGSLLLCVLPTKSALQFRRHYNKNKVMFVGASTNSSSHSSDLRSICYERGDGGGSTVWLYGDLFQTRQQQRSPVKTLGGRNRRRLPPADAKWSPGRGRPPHGAHILVSMMIICVFALHFEFLHNSAAESWAICGGGSVHRAFVYASSGHVLRVRCWR